MIVFEQSELRHAADWRGVSPIGAPELALDAFLHTAADSGAMLAALPATLPAVNLLLARRRADVSVSMHPRQSARPAFTSLSSPTSVTTRSIQSAAERSDSATSRVFSLPCIDSHSARRRPVVQGRGQHAGWRPAPGPPRPPPCSAAPARFAHRQWHGSWQARSPAGAVAGLTVEVVIQPRHDVCCGGVFASVEVG